MSHLNVIAYILIIVGAIINFLVPVALKKSDIPAEVKTKKIYLVKSAGLLLVIAGCVIIFWLGGKFGV